MSLRWSCTSFWIALAVLASTQPSLSQAVSMAVSTQLSEPTTCDGIVYLGSDAGLLHGVRASDGLPISGFPVDVGAAMGDGSVLYWLGQGCRPGVYYGLLGKAIYLETSKHGVVKVRPDGTIAWVNKLGTPSTYEGSATPSVTHNGEVITEMKTTDNVYIVKLRESDGTLIATSPPLAQFYSNLISSTAVVGDLIYTTVYYYPAAGLHHNVTVLNLADLTVKATHYGSGSDTAPPYVRDGGVFFGGGFQGADVFKLNAATLNPDPVFGAGVSGNIPGVTTVLPDILGHPGISEVCASPKAADRDAGGTVYASVSYGNVTARVVAVNAVSGAVRVLYDSGGEGGPGLVVSPKGVIAYGTGRN